MWERTSIDIVTYIEGEPKIGIVPIEPGLTNIEKTDESGQYSMWADLYHHKRKEIL